MCAYKYVFNKHMFKGGGGGGGCSGADSRINYRGSPCIGEGSGDRLGPQRGPEQRPMMGGSRWGVFLKVLGIRNLRS